MAPERTLSNTKQFEFYTPTPRENGADSHTEAEKFLVASRVLDEHAQRNEKNQHFAGLVQKCIQPFYENTPIEGRKAYVDRIQVFTDGDRPYSPMDPEHKEKFKEEATKVIAEFAQDCFREDGKSFKSGEHEQAWYNLVEIAPQIIEILTDRKNYITLVHKDHALNIIASALHIAHHPNTEVVIKTGIGGSDDEFTSVRLPAYALPAVHIAENISQFYEKRREDKILDTAINKRYAQVLQDHGETFLEKDGRKRVKAKIRVVLESEADKSYGLTEDEQAKVEEKYAIGKIPSVQFFFAHEASIAINHGSMDTNRIVPRAEENMSVLRNYVEKHHPHISQNVEYVKDVPWKEHNLYQKVLIEYLASVLRNSDDPTVQKTLQTLEKLGNNHGGENGSEKAAEYAAMHPLAFGDRMNLPFTPYLEGQNHNPTINITIGGRTERHFCAVREYLARNVSPDSLIAFVQDKLAASQNTEEKTSLAKMPDRVERWKRLVTQSRMRYSNPKALSTGYLARPDKPLHEIMLITSIGNAPTYYITGFDKPHGTVLSVQIDRLKSKRESVTDPIERDKLEGVIFDLEALREDQDDISDTQNGQTSG